VKYFDWDDAKNAKLRAERRIGIEDIVFHIERGDLLDILEHPNPDRLRVPRPVHRGRAHGLPDDHHPESEGDETILGRGGP